MHDATLVGGFPEPAKRGVSSLQSLINRMSGRLRSGDSLVTVVRSLITDLDYLGSIARTYSTDEEIQQRQSSVEEVVNAIAEYEAEEDDPTLAGFLDNVALSGKEFTGSKEKERQYNSVSLMTYHSAKGLEFPVVYMVGMEEGILPHRRSITDNEVDVEEERRLCYVGVTRAQDELSLSLPLQRMKWGRPRDTFASRFLYELTNQADNPNRRRAIEGVRKEVAQANRAAAAKAKAPKAPTNHPRQRNNVSATFVWLG